MKEIKEDFIKKEIKKIKDIAKEEINRKLKECDKYIKNSNIFDCKLKLKIYKEGIRTIKHVTTNSIKGLFINENYILFRYLSLENLQVILNAMENDLGNDDKSKITSQFINKEINNLKHMAIEEIGRKLRECKKYSNNSNTFDCSQILIKDVKQHFNDLYIARIQLHKNETITAKIRMVEYGTEVILDKLSLDDLHNILWCIETDLGESPF